MKRKKKEGTFKACIIGMPKCKEWI
jgi:hypothetical protein